MTRYEGEKSRLFARDFMNAFTRSKIDLSADGVGA